MTRYGLSLLLLLLSSCVLAEVAVEGRIKFQHIENNELSDTDLSTNFARLLLKADLPLSNNSLFYLETIAAYDSSFAQGKYSFEHNEFDLHQGYLSVTSPNHAIKLGRQVWSVADQRLLGKREGTNVRRRFDGVMYQNNVLNQLQINAYHGYAVASKTGVFDDKYLSSERITGVYFSTAELLLHSMWYRDTTAENNESRHTIEAQYRKKLGRFSSTFHVAHQTGIVKSEHTKAWFAQFSGLYSFANLKFGPTLSYATGGEAGHEDGYFRSLYAKAPYYSEAGIFSTTNIKHIGAKLQAQLTDKFDISLDMRRLFRVNEQGDIFGPGRSLFIANEQLKGAKIADTYSLTTQYLYTKKISFELITSYINMSNRANLEKDQSFFVEAMLHFAY
ncbi:alginate export family protein [Pseudoalteromonas sp. SR45-4]|uniref:alginate export family protein n=1 Tax=Pseudoalteromonas sp. SR45-4 TaxID=2760929 RepID=UPI0015F8F78F|nr:alginate export family protein [Pseudoalteromonas sp. SR45-4]MBB1372555.1 alginate export family protein [Pseudoalteromonas sp. SR45-4]